MIGQIDPGLVGVIGAVLGGGVIGGIVALFKLKPDIAQINVSTAQGAVIVQSGVIQSLNEENARLHERQQALEEDNAALTERVKSLERSMGSANDAQNARIRTLENENAGLREENIRLQERVGMLELELEGLRLNGGG